MNKVKTFLWVFVAILALIAVGSFAVQAMPIKTVPSEKCKIEVISDYCTYSFTDSTENVVTEFFVGETYTLNATSDYGYNLQSVSFNNEVVSLPYTFVASVNDFVTISTEPITIIPNVISALSDYSFTNINDEVVTEFTFGETYTITVIPTYCAEFEKIVFNNEIITENSYTFILDTTSVNLEIWSNYSELPYSVSAENCSYYFMDVVGNYPTELKLGTIYTLYANPVDGYTITSATLNGMEISLPYQFSCNSPGETYDFVIYTQETVSNIIPSVSLPYHTYTFKDVNNNVVTELIPGQTYDFIAYNEYGYYINNLYLNNEILVHSFNNWLDDNGLLTERIYTFIATEEIIITSEVLMNSTMPNCDGLGSWRFQDVETLEYTYELYYLKTYIATFEPELNYVLTSARHNGEEISLPYTFTPTSPCSFEATTEYVEPVDNSVSITLNYDSNICSACITDTDGNAVSEFAQNTDYIIVVNPFNGYEVSSIIWQPGIELTNNSVFNTGSTESIPIFITCTPFTFTPEVSAENCYYSFTDSNGNTTTTLTYGETFTISGGGNYGYDTPMLTINNSGMYDLPYTFTVNELPFTFQLTTSPSCVVCSDIVEATNCSYKFFDSNNNYVTNLVFGESYTLTATADDGYTISSVEYIGQTYSLPYTFVLNNLELRFTLDASRNEFANFTINYSGLPSGLTANAKILGMEATDSIIMFDIVSESFSSSVTSNVDLNSLSLDLNYFRVAVDDVPYGYEVTSLIVNSVNYEVYESTTNCYLTYSDNLINLSNISYTIDVIFSELTSSTAYVLTSGCSESSACSVYFYLKNDAEIDIDNNFFNASVCVDAYNGVNGPADFSDYLQHNKFMKIRLVLPYLTNLVSLNATLNNNSISFNCVDSSLGIYESTEVFEFPCKKYELNLYFVLSMATTSIVSSSSNCIYEFTDTDGNVVTSLIVGNEYTLNVSPIDGYGSLVCTYVGQDITNPYTFTLTDTSGRFVFSASE